MIGRIGIAMLCLGGVTAAEMSGSASPFAQQTLWDDGLAEVSEYTLTQAHYGQLFTGTVTTIVVRELLDADTLVKAMPGVDAVIPVLKAHRVAHFQTGVYAYEQADTSFLTRDDLTPMRMFWDSHEWCGLASLTWTNAGADSRIRGHSYFDGHGDRDDALVFAPQAVFADSMWLWLRHYLELPQPPATVTLIPSQIGAKWQSTQPLTVTIQRRDPRHLPATPLGLIGISQLSVMDVQGNMLMQVELELAFPHRLMSAQWPNGTTWALIRTARFDYWNRHNLGDTWP